MTDNQGSHYQKNDDLDLAVLLRKAIGFFRTYGRLILITSLAGLFCGFILNKSFPKHYMTRMVLESTLLTNSEQNELISNWDLLLNGNGYPILQKTFNCSPETIRNIGGFSLESFPALVDGTNSFAVNVAIRDSSRLKDVQDAIVYGFGNNEYVRLKVAIRKENYQHLIDQGNREINKLDSTKNWIESFARDEKKDNDRIILDVSAVSKQRFEISEKLADFKQKLALSDAVQLIQEATPPKGPKPGTTTFLVMGLAAGFLIGYFFSLILSLIRV
jgi:hypothetical protein